MRHKGKYKLYVVYYYRKLIQDGIFGAGGNDKKI